MEFDTLILIDKLAKMSNQKLIAYAKGKDGAITSDHYKTICDEFEKRGMEMPAWTASSLPKENEHAEELNTFKKKHKNIYKYIFHKVVRGATFGSLARELKDDEGLSDDDVVSILNGFNTKFQKNYNRTIKNWHYPYALFGVFMFDNDISFTIKILVIGVMSIFSVVLHRYFSNRYEKVQKAVNDEKEMFVRNDSQE